MRIQTGLRKDYSHRGAKNLRGRWNGGNGTVGTDGRWPESRAAMLSGGLEFAAKKCLKNELSAGQTEWELGLADYPNAGL